MHAKLALTYLVLLCACGKKKESRAPEDVDMDGLGSAKGADDMAGSAGIGWIVSIDASQATDPRASALMKWVVPLKKGSTIACSSTQIGARSLVTAAHCVDGGAPAIPAVSTNAFANLPYDHRACAHGAGASCATEFPVGDYNYFRHDIATIWLDDTLPSADAPELGHLDGYGDVPGSFMLSARTGLAHPICRAHVSEGVGDVEGWIEKGDSGSAIVAFRSNGSAVILGVVSHRWESQGHWYFAMVPTALPWPSAATTPPPLVASYYESDFDHIQDCQ